MFSILSMIFSVYVDKRLQLAADSGFYEPQGAAAAGK